MAEEIIAQEEEQQVDNTQQQIPEQQEPPKKLSVKEFAAKVKEKYPEYNSVADDILVTKMIDKYPAYKDQVDISQKKNSGQPSSTGATKSSPTPSPLQGGKSSWETSPLNPVFAATQAQAKKEEEKKIMPQPTPTVGKKAIPQRKPIAENDGNVFQGIEDYSKYVWDRTVETVGRVASGAVKGLGRMIAMGDDPNIPKEELIKGADEIGEKVKKEITSPLTSNLTEKRKQDFDGSFIKSTIASLPGLALESQVPYGVGFMADAFDGAITNINNTKEGAKLPESIKTIYAACSAAAMGLTMKIGLDKIVGNKISAVTNKLTAETLTKLLSESEAPITKTAFEAAFKETAKTFKNKLLTTTAKVGHSTAVGAAFMGTNEALNVMAEKAINKYEKKDIFEPTSFGQDVARVITAGAHGAGFGLIMGGMHVPFNKVDNYIKTKVAEAKTPEDINNLKQELITNVQNKSVDENSAQRINSLIDEYTSIHSQIPPEVKNRQQVADRIKQSNDLKQQATETLESSTNLHPAFQAERIQEAQLLSKTAEDIDNRIAEKPIYKIGDREVDRDAFDKFIKSEDAITQDVELYVEGDNEMSAELEKIGGVSKIADEEAGIPERTIKTTKAYDTENKPGLPSEIGVGEELVQAQPIESGGAQEISGGGVLQTPGAEGEGKAVEQKVGEVKPEEADIEKRRQEELESKGLNRLFPLLDEANPEAKKIAQEMKEQQKSINEVNAKYDAELNALKEKQQAELPKQEGVEKVGEKVSPEETDIEKRRKNELSNFDENITKKGRLISDAGEVETFINADGEWTVSTSLPKDKNRTWEKTRNEGLSGVFKTKEEALEFAKSVIDKLKEKTNTRYDAELKALKEKQQAELLKQAEAPTPSVEAATISNIPENIQSEIDSIIEYHTKQLQKAKDENDGDDWGIEYHSEKLEKLKSNPIDYLIEDLQYILHNSKVEISMINENKIKKFFTKGAKEREQYLKQKIKKKNQEIDKLKDLKEKQAELPKQAEATTPSVEAKGVGEDVEATAKALESADKNIVEKIANTIGETLNKNKAKIDVENNSAITSKGKQIKFRISKNTDTEIEQDFLIITAVDNNGNKVGYAKFIDNGKNNLEGSEVDVPSKYQKQGIASAIYSFADAKGYKIKESVLKTPEGKALWKSLNTKQGSIKSIAEAYHKAKADGTNPELVKAVEQSLKETPKAELPKQKAIEAKPTEVVAKKEGVGEVKAEVPEPKEEVKDWSELAAAKRKRGKASDMAVIKRVDAKKTYSQVSSIDTPTDPYGLAKQWLSSGGKVSVESFAKEVTGLRRSRGAAKISIPTDAKISEFTDSKSKLSVAQAAHDLWESLPDEVRDNTTDTDVRNALIDLLQSYNKRLDVARDFISEYDAENAAKKYYDSIAEEFPDEYEKDQKAVEDWMKSEAEKELEITIDDEYINQLKQQYEQESKGVEENIEQPTIGEAEGRNKEISGTKPVGKEKVAGEEVKAEAPKEAKLVVEKAEPPVPPTVTEKGTIEGGEDAIKGITMADNAMRRAEINMPERQPNPETVEEWRAEAEKQISEGYNINDLIEKMEKGETTDKVENEISRIFAATLDAEVKKNPSNENIDKYERLIKAREKSSSEIGKSLRALRGVSNPYENISDFYVAKKEANKVDNLTDKQKAEVQKDFENIQKARDEYKQKWNEAEAKFTEMQAQNELLRQAKESEGKTKKKAETSQAIKEKALSQKGKDIADQIRKLKLKGAKVDLSLGTWNLAVEGIAKLVESGATIAEAIDTLIKDGTIGFKSNKDREAFEDELLGGMGSTTKKEPIAEREELKEKLKSEIEKNKSNSDKLGIDSKNGAKDFVITSKMAKIINKISKSHIEEVGAKLSEVTRKTLDDVKDLFDGITTKDIQDVIAGKYSERKETKSELVANLRQIQAEAKLLSELDRVLAGEPKTEKQKVERNQKLADLRRQINDVKKSGGLEEYSQEAKAEKATKAAEENIKELEDKLVKNDLDVQQAQKVNSPELEVLRKKQKQLRSELESKRKEEGIGKYSQEAIAKKAIEANKRKEEKLKERLANNDFEPEAKKESIYDSKEFKKSNAKLYKELLDSQVKKQEAELEFHKKIVENEMANMGKVDKFKQVLTKARGTLKAIFAGIDDSAVGVQNWFQAITNPVIGAKAIKEHVLDFWSQSRFDRGIEELHNSGDWNIIKESGLRVSEPTSLLEEGKDEMFPDRFKAIIKLKGKEYGHTEIGGKKYELFDILKPFERAFTSLGNNLRVIKFRTDAEKMYQKGITFENNPEEFKKLATRINAMTSASEPNKAFKADYLNLAIWSPRLMASKLNILGISDLASYTPLVKQGYYRSLGEKGKILSKQQLYAAADLAKFATSVVAASYLYSAARGGQLNTDPYDNNFMDVELPNGKSYNFTGGFSKYISTIFQIARGGKTNKSTGQFEKYKGFKDRGSEVMHFLRGKMPPISGSTVNLAVGKDYTGKETSLSTEAEKYKMPMAVGQIYGQIQKDGYGSLFMDGLPTFLGVNVKDKRDYVKTDLFTKEELEKSPSVKILTESELKVPSVREISSYSVKEDINHLDGKMTPEEYEKFKPLLKEYSKERIERFASLYDTELSNLNEMIKKQEKTPELKLEIIKLKEKLQNKLDSYNQDAIKKAKREIGIR